MSVITFPSGVNFSSMSLTLERSSISLMSKFTGKRQVLVLPYAVWKFKGKFSKTDTTIAGTLRAFFAQLDGQGNKFRLPIPGTTSLLSAYAGAAGLVNGASQTGSTLATDGWSNSTLVLSVGDYFTVNDELKVVTAAATTNGSGQVTISFKPALISSPADNAALTIVSPTVMMALDNDDGASWDVSPPTLHDFSLECTQAIE